MVHDTCSRRLSSEIYHIMKDELPGICISPDEEDITRVTAIIIGPKYTPYE
eukprot:CAMPEP_0174296794 /NCGR_PEP_ID=MMETSP0809-20121228/48985_1 /TAXON_ID=73025 ORGANISM="Eutreptiella gymnastica-like, Strain CCMP1594" /NCGR_SAMPLE_ID=MMETSP0809 /ASSEMBLY_ACC=CAM_ASM_000658 /LENGTH=50 /DNA_ID=CAMNT_0015400055 /DNA_START=12 /DNA_END=161 /DNA_ORIENTATION=+